MTRPFVVILGLAGISTAAVSNGAATLRYPNPVQAAIGTVEPATRGRLAAAGINADPRRVSLLARVRLPAGVPIVRLFGNGFELSDGDTYAVTQTGVVLVGHQPVSGNVASRTTSRALYATPDKYVALRHGPGIDTITAQGFENGHVVLAAPKGRIIGMEYQPGPRGFDGHITTYVRTGENDGLFLSLAPPEL
ncbi:hypothetical protein [uncultured Sphingomonas sp.]|uniref:hypothetical protein n=1 Tax=uncultured Sphingomonas sp. TaxID=158754 RepID=UPI0035CB6B50